MFSSSFGGHARWKHFARGRHAFFGDPGHVGRGRGGRGRGEMKYEILAVLDGGPRHGYDIMLEIESRRGMRPSPGSIYPALQMLEDGEFVRGAEHDGKRIYTITEKGRALLKERPAVDDEAAAGGVEAYALMAEAMRHVLGIKDAAKHIARSGDITLFRRAVKLLDRTRREMYAFLSEDGEE